MRNDYGHDGFLQVPPSRLPGGNGSDGGGVGCGVRSYGDGGDRNDGGVSNDGGDSCNRGDSSDGSDSSDSHEGGCVDSEATGYEQCRLVVRLKYCARSESRTLETSLGLARSRLRKYISAAG